MKSRRKERVELERINRETVERNKKEEWMNRMIEEIDWQNAWFRYPWKSIIWERSKVRNVILTLP